MTYSEAVDYILDIPKCTNLKERLALDITNGSTNLDDGNLCLFCCKITEETALDLICDVRDYLYSSTAIVTTALLLQYGPVYLSGCHI